MRSAGSDGSPHCRRQRGQPTHEQAGGRSGSHLLPGDVDVRQRAAVVELERPVQPRRLRAGGVLAPAVEVLHPDAGPRAERTAPQPGPRAGALPQRRPHHRPCLRHAAVGLCWTHGSWSLCRNPGWAGPGSLQPPGLAGGPPCSPGLAVSSAQPAHPPLALGAWMASLLIRLMPDACEGCEPGSVIPCMMFGRFAWAKRGQMRAFIRRAAARAGHRRARRCRIAGTGRGTARGRPSRPQSPSA